MDFKYSGLQFVNYSENNLELFCQNDLFKGLPRDQVEKLYSISTQVILEPGEYLIREGEDANDIFLVLDGSLEVFKYDAKNNENYHISVVNAGNSIGEIALLDRGPRSASAQASERCLVCKIVYADLLRIVEENPALNSLFLHLASNVGQRLRRTDDVVVEALKAKVEEYKTRNQMGSWLILVVSGLCVIAFAIPGIKWMISLTPHRSIFVIPFITILGIAVYLCNRVMKIPYRVFGLVLDRWKQSVFEGIVFSIPVLVFITFVKWLAIQFVPSFYNESLFNPYSHFNNPATHTLSDWLVMQGLYVLFVPIQEIMARGFLQSLLERFLLLKHKNLLAIIVSNLIFSELHLFLPVHFAIMVFISGLYFGWLYLRTHNLISPMIAHAIVGVWGVAVLGF